VLEPLPVPLRCAITGARTTSTLSLKQSTSSSCRPRRSTTRARARRSNRSQRQPRMESDDDDFGAGRSKFRRLCGDRGPKRREPQFLHVGCESTSAHRSSYRLRTPTLIAAGSATTGGRTLGHSTCRPVASPTYLWLPIIRSGRIWGGDGVLEAACGSVEQNGAGLFGVASGRRTVPVAIVGGSARGDSDW
jgi:hypothetical protein